MTELHLIVRTSGLCSISFYSEGIKVEAWHVSVSSNVRADRSMMDGSQADARTLGRGRMGAFLSPVMCGEELRPGEDYS